MINVGELLTDPDFAQAFTIKRSSGAFGLGGFLATTSNVRGAGVITVATEEDLMQVPEGDRVTGSMMFYSRKPIYATRAGSAAGLSDLIAWRGQTYRIAKVFPYQDYGFYKAIGVRMSGE
jgi:hypothetical protein